METSDLGPVPDLLRSILEDTLSQEASPASLDRFLPRIRDIIINLLHGLKRKQQRLRARQAKESIGSSGVPTGRQSSVGSITSNGGDMPQTQENPTLQRSAPSKTGDRRYGSGNIMAGDEPEVPHRISSAQNGATPNVREDWGMDTADVYNRDASNGVRRSIPPSTSDSSISSNTMQNIPVLLPEGDGYPIENTSISERETLPPPRPPPPPKQQDALAALQRGGDLERRASRRYSAYQISKHLGASPNGVPMLPPAQNSPIPNRGRNDARDSMNAVRIRGSLLPSRQRSTNRPVDRSPTRNNAMSNRISEESCQVSDTPVMKPPPEPLVDDSPLTKTPEDKLRLPFSETNDNPTVSATLEGPPTDDISSGPPYDVAGSPIEPSRRTLDRRGAITAEDVPMPTVNGEPQTQHFVPEQSPQPGKELTLFLQYKSRIKKFVLPDGSNDLSIARLQLAFIEKFAWNTHSNGNDLPEIYIQDPVSGVRHELEDLADVKDRSVLVLNVEVLDEVKRHFDEGIGGLKRMVEGMRTVVDGQQSTLLHMSDRQQDAAKSMARLSATSIPQATPATPADTPRVNGTNPSTPSKGTSDQVSEVQSLRRDLAVVRQTYSSFASEMNASMASVRAKASSIKSVAIDTTIPSMPISKGRSYVGNGRKALDEESKKIVNKVDELQDTVEDLRKDVVTRGVRPLPRQLESVSKDVSVATSELKKMQEYLKREKPKWTKIWEGELQLVCDERDFLTMQEDLAADLEDDLDKATQTFALVEEATKQQNIQNGGAGNSMRSTSRGLNALAADQDVDPSKARDGVLGEVRALQPNHETRLEAIERAEKARQRELESRKDGAFKKELGNFVEEGKLKKSGGVEEAERLRKAKDERNRRAAWETQQARAAGKGKEAEGDIAQAEEIDANGEGLEGGQESPEVEHTKAVQEEVGTKSGLVSSNQGM